MLAYLCFSNSMLTLTGAMLTLTCAMLTLTAYFRCYVFQAIAVERNNLSIAFTQSMCGFDVDYPYMYTSHVIQCSAYPSIFNRNTQYIQVYIKWP